MSIHKVGNLATASVDGRYLRTGQTILAFGGDVLDEPKTITHGYVNGSDDSYHGWDQNGRPFVIHGNDPVTIAIGGLPPQEPPKRSPFTLDDFFSDTPAA